MGRRHLGRAPGFTLLELLVVLLVVAVVAGVVVPSIGRGADAIRARADVARFAATLRRARQEAITAREPRAVVVDPAARRVSIVAGPDGARAAWPLPDELVVRSVPAASLEVRFEPHGVSSGGDFRITAHGRQFRVTVDALTGRVRSTRE